MPPNPLISVIIPNYNYGRYLEECVQSVLKQTYSNVEIIIVDDASTDVSESVYMQFEYLRNITVLRNGVNTGVVYSRNRGIEVAKGEYIALLDPDDYWLPDKLMKQVRAIEKNGCEVVCSSTLIVNSKGVVSIRHSIFKDISYSSMLKSNSISHSTVLIRKELFAREEYYEVENPFYKKGLPFISKYKKLIHEDFALFLRLLRNSNVGVCYIDEPLVAYRIHPVSYSSGIFKKALSTYVIFWKQERFSVLKSVFYTLRLLMFATIKNRMKG